jgi:hypothetical protein
VTDSPDDRPSRRRPSRGAAPSESSSPGSSTPEPGDDPLVADPGPGFVPGTDPGTPGSEEPGIPGDGELLAALEPEVSEEQVRAFLRNLGDGLHAVAGVGDLDWVMTDADQDRLGPPIARLAARYEPLRAVAARSDEAAVAIGMGLYTWRSLLERQAVLRAREREPTAVAPEQRTPGPPAPAPPTRPPASPPAGPTIDLPDNYVPAAERLRATRPPED